MKKKYTDFNDNFGRENKKNNMKTKLFFTVVIIIIIAVLCYYGVDKIFLVSLLFGVAVGFATWIYIECDEDEEDSQKAKAFWCITSIILFVLCCILNEIFDNENVKNSIQYAAILPALNCIFSFSTTI